MRERGVNVTASSVWRSAHVYYYDENKDGLILDAVRPLFSSVARESVDAYFRRHWRRGPHVRLQFRSSETVFSNVVRPAIYDFIGGFLAAHPSRVEIPDPRMLAVHERLAVAEREKGPLTPWLGDNTIHEVPYESRSRTVGGDKASGILADFYVATNDLAFDMIDSVRGGAPKLAPCFDLMVATAQAFARGGFRFGFVSFRSHAEVFLASTLRPDEGRSKWDRQYRAAKLALGQRVRDVLALTERTQGTGTLVGRWIRHVAPIAGRVSTLVTRGEMSFEGTAPESRVGSMSAFHRTLRGGEFFMAHVKDSEWFLCYRAVLNYLYLHLSRIGVRPVERFLLCHLAANAAEDLFGVSAMDIARRGV